MKIEIQLSTENDAFVDFRRELTRILGTIPGKIEKQLSREPCLCEAPEAADKLLDLNGNTVGWVTVKR